MLELFTFGTIWFWILLSAAFIWILWFIENGDEPSGTGATVVFCAFMIISCFLGNRAAFMNAISYIKESPGIIISVFLAYLVFGVIWSFVKWYLYLTWIRTKHINGRDKYLTIPSFGNNKARIITWMSYWPLSMLFTVINDPIRRSFEFISTKFSGAYQKMSDKIFKDFLKD